MDLCEASLRLGLCSVELKDSELLPVSATLRKYLKGVRPLRGICPREQPVQRPWAGFERSQAG